jgi:hypothetical protein
MHGGAMNPLTSILVAALVGMAIGAGGAGKVVANHYRAEAAEQKEADAKAYQARTVELNQVSAELERARHDRKVVYRTITQRVENVVTRDVYRNVCLDADGVLLVNSALTGRASPGEPAAAMPAAGTATGNDRR